MMNYMHKRSAMNQAGFTLIEIMVGMVIGMLATLVIIQVLSVFENQKRMTTGTADAQTNGSVALYTIGREMQTAGYPLMPAANSPLECTTVTFGATGITSISPVTITDTGGSDSVTIRYGSSLGGGIPTVIGAAPVGNAVTLGTTLSPGSNLGCQVNDVTVVVNGATCALSTVTALSTGVTPPTVTLQNVASVAAGSNLACLGTWNSITYDVNNSTLRRAGVNSVPEIVNIQAQYGIAASGLLNTNPLFNQVTQWVDATGTWAAPTVANRNRIKAIRIAVVARNSKMEPGTMTAACSSTTAASPTGLCAWAGSVASPAPTINLAADANWARYRYRVFETIIPLRNMYWSRETL